MSVKIVNHENYKAEVTENAGTVILDFYADWCGPCMMLKPFMEELSDELPDVSFCKINVDDEPALAGAFGIVSIPTIIKFRGGKNVDQSVGYMGKDSLKGWIIK